MAAHPESRTPDQERAQELLRRALRSPGPAGPPLPVIPGQRTAAEGPGSTRRERRSHRDETRSGGKAAAGRRITPATNPRHLAYRRQG